MSFEKLSLLSLAALMLAAAPAGAVPKISTVEGWVVDEQKAKSASLQCPEGTSVVGQPHPDGLEQSCQRADGSKHGAQIQWHDNGQVKTRGQFSENKQTGAWTSWQDNGQKNISSTWAEGVKVGTWTEWWGDDRPQEQGDYRDDKKVGTWTTWGVFGDKQESVEWQDGKQHGQY